MKINGIDIEEGSKYYYSLMNEESVTLVFNTDTPVDFSIGDTITLGSISGLPGSAAGSYILMETPTISYSQDTGGYRYEVKYHKKYWWLKNIIFKFSPKRGGSEAAWSLTASIKTFKKVLEDNLSSANCGVTKVSYDTSIKGGENTSQALSFSNTSILEAINTIADKWECEWWVDDDTLKFGKCSEGSSASFELNDNVESISPQDGDNDFANTFYVFGSDKNIPSWYRKTLSLDNITLYPSNYRKSAYSYGDSINLTSDVAKNESYNNEGQQVHAVGYRAYSESGNNKGTYFLNFGNPTITVGKIEGVSGTIMLSLQCSEDGSAWKTVDKFAYIPTASEDANSLSFSKTSYYLTSYTGNIYMRLFIEFVSKDDAYVNIVPSFSFSAKAVYVNGEHDNDPSAGLTSKSTNGLKYGSLPSTAFSSNLDSKDVNCAVVTSRLMLPTSCSNNAITNGTGAAIERVLVFEDVYPQSEFTVSGLSLKAYTNSIEMESGEIVKETWYAYQFASPSDFSIDDILEGKTLKCRFSSGALNGMEFELSYNPGGYADNDERANVFELVRNEDYGRALPDLTLCPAAGDTYDLINVDITAFGDTIGTAEAKLKSLADEYIEDLTGNKSNYEVTMACDDDGVYELGCGATLVGLGTTKTGRIIAMEIPLDIPYDHPKYTVGNSANYSKFGELGSTINGIVHDAGNINGGTSIYLIKSSDATPASDVNAYSAARSDANYISKFKEDQAKKLISFAEGLVSYGMIRSYGKILTTKDIESTDFITSKQGFYLGKEKSGNDTILEVDKLKIRKNLIYSNVDIRHKTHLGGCAIVSSGAAELVKVMSKDEMTARITTINQQIVKIGEAKTDYETQILANYATEKASMNFTRSTDFYRCWFKAEDSDGNTATNEFKVGDLAICEKYISASERHFYWRYVIGIGEDYIDLSNEVQCNDSTTSVANGYLTGSEIPSDGDTLIQLGHVSNKARQNAIFISSEEAGAPMIVTYHGINHFNLTGCEATMQYYDTTKQRMVEKVYGDMYIGDRSNNTYIDFNQDTGLKMKIVSKDITIGNKQGDKLLEEIENVSRDINSTKLQLDESFQVYKVDNNAEVDTENKVVENMAVTQYTWLPSYSWEEEKYTEHVGDFILTSDGVCYIFNYKEEDESFYWMIVTDRYLIQAIEEVNAVNIQMAAMADDNIITIEEKPTLKNIWQNQKSEYEELCTKIDEFWKDQSEPQFYTNLKYSYSDLSTIVTYILTTSGNVTLNTAINNLSLHTPGRSTYMDYWNVYITDKTIAQTEIDKMIKTATDGNTEVLDDMASDLVITKQEKMMLELIYIVEENKQAQLEGECEKAGFLGDMWAKSVVEYNESTLDIESSITQKIGSVTSAGKYIKSIVPYYKGTIDNVQPSASGGDSNIDSLKTFGESYKYLWRWLKVVDSDDNETTTTPILIAQENDARKGITNVTEQIVIVDSTYSEILSSNAGWHNISFLSAFNNDFEYYVKYLIWKAIFKAMVDIIKADTSASYSLKSDGSWKVYSATALGATRYSTSDNTFTGTPKTFNEIWSEYVTDYSAVKKLVTMYLKNDVTSSFNGISDLNKEMYGQDGFVQILRSNWSALVQKAGSDLSSLVLTSNFASLFSSSVDSDGKIKAIASIVTEVKDNKAKVSIQANDITITGDDFSVQEGKITAKGGTIGGLSIKSDELVASTEVKDKDSNVIGHNNLRYRGDFLTSDYTELVNVAAEGEEAQYEDRYRYNRWAIESNGTVYFGVVPVVDNEGNVVPNEDGSWKTKSATSFNKDGSGHLAFGNVTWTSTGSLSVKGKIEADEGQIGSFIIDTNGNLKAGTGDTMVIGAGGINSNCGTTQQQFKAGITAKDSFQAVAVSITNSVDYPAMKLKSGTGGAKALVTEGDLQFDKLTGSSSSKAVFNLEAVFNGGLSGAFKGSQLMRIKNVTASTYTIDDNYDLIYFDKDCTIIVNSNIPIGKVIYIYPQGHAITFPSTGFQFANAQSNHELNGSPIHYIIKINDTQWLLGWFSV